MELTAQQIEAYRLFLQDGAEEGRRQHMAAVKDAIRRGILKGTEDEFETYMILGKEN